MEELQAGDPPQIGPYLLLGRLGAGGMGQVFLGRSPGGRLVAVKVIRAELAGDPGFRARFAREVAAARKVSGVNRGGGRCRSRGAAALAGHCLCDRAVAG